MHLSYLMQPDKEKQRKGSRISKMRRKLKREAVE